MTQKRRYAVVGAFLIAMASLVCAQEPEPIVDPEAYTIYALLVSPLWMTESKEPLLLQRETVSWECQGVKPPDEDWQSVLDNFRQEDARVRLLQPRLPIGMSYRLISKVDIAADDARLAIKYPGIYQRRPESLEYAAVSTVGFNPAKTKAMVYLRLRMSGSTYFLEKRDGVWVRSLALERCVWIA